MRNFGQKSLDELKERLALRGFIAPEVEAILSHKPDLVIGLEDTHGKLAPALKDATTFTLAPEQRDKGRIRLRLDLEIEGVE